jgi:hypothetical protein
MLINASVLIFFLEYATMFSMKMLNVFTLVSECADTVFERQTFNAATPTMYVPIAFQGIMNPIRDMDVSLIIQSHAMYSSTSTHALTPAKTSNAWQDRNQQRYNPPQ